MKKSLLASLIALFSIGIAHAQATPPIIAQFFGIWTDKNQTWEDKFREDTPFEKLNRLYIAFGKVVKTDDGQFTIAFDGREERVEAIIDRVKKVNPTADIMLVVGGDGSPNSYGGAANDPLFAEHVKNFLNHYGFTGLDIDWEMDISKQQLNSLLVNLYGTLHSSGYLLTLDVWPYGSSLYDISILKNNIDQINIMSYGKSSNLLNCIKNYGNAGFPSEKMIGGIETERGYGESGGVDTLGLQGSIAAKANIALTQHLAGMMEWRLDNDYTTEAKPTYPSYQGAEELWKDLHA